MGEDLDGERGVRPLGRGRRKEAKSPRAAEISAAVGILILAIPVLEMINAILSLFCISLTEFTLSVSPNLFLYLTFDSLITNDVSYLSLPLLKGPFLGSDPSR